MSYFAIKTAGKRVDYEWQTYPPEVSEIHKELDTLTDDDLSYAVLCERSSYSVYFGRIKTDLVDRLGRGIRVSAAFCRISNYNARCLVVFALSKPDELREALCAAIDWNDANSGGEWAVDFERVKAILAKAGSETSVKKSSKNFTDALERFYTTNSNDSEEDVRSADSIRQLSKELESASFSLTEGVKLLISKAASEQGYRRAEIEADRLLSSFHEKRDLFEVREQLKKKATTRTTAVGSPHSPFHPNPRLIKILIISGVILVGVILVVTIKKNTS
jgi:hypothetical protein